MFDLDQVKRLQVESTTKCNAWCPGCARNDNGYQLNKSLKLVNLSTEQFKQALNLLPNVTLIDFCGVHGDAILSPNIFELTALAQERAEKVMIRTNGSLRNLKWWKDYAKLLSPTDHEVWFCIDGLEDTHSIYRQATNWQKIIDNAKAFMSAGGTAVWQFIPWKHNEHQIKDCIKLSQQLGFKSFKAITNVRQNFSARHWRTGEPVDIQPWSQDHIINELVQVKVGVEAKKCMHLSDPSVYLNATGTLSNCCYLNHKYSVPIGDSLFDIQKTLDNKKWLPTCLQYCGTSLK